MDIDTAAIITSSYGYLHGRQDELKEVCYRAALRLTEHHATHEQNKEIKQLWLHMDMSMDACTKSEQWIPTVLSSRAEAAPLSGNPPSLS